MFRLLLPQFYDERWISLSLLWKIVCFASHTSGHACSCTLVWLLCWHSLVGFGGRLGITQINLFPSRWSQIGSTNSRSPSECIQMAWLVAGCHRMKQYFSPNPLLISSSSCCHAAGCTHQPISSPVQHYITTLTSHIINPRIMMLHA